MHALTTKGHEEIHVEKGLILIQVGRTSDFDVIGDAVNITFNDQYVSYTKNGQGFYRELNGWRIKVYPFNASPNKPVRTVRQRQLNIFDFLEETQ